MGTWGFTAGQLKVFVSTVDTLATVGSSRSGIDSEVDFRVCISSNRTSLLWSEFNRLGGSVGDLSIRYYLPIMKFGD